MRTTLRVWLVLSLIAGLAAADGPETGVVSGRVTDVQGQNLPGVMVTIDSPRGAQSTVTNEAGYYRFALLVPGSYTVKGMLEGFQEAAGSAQVSAGGKAEINLVMALGTEETITVTSEAPMVDKFNVTAGGSLTGEVGQQMAGTTRSYYGMINMLPGVTNDADNRDIQEMRPSVNGGHFADQGVYIDGVDTTFSRLGGSRVILPTTATTEVTMEAGGAGAEYGRVVGSSTNVIIKSGTNTFHGDVLGEYSKGSWYGEYDEHPILETLQIGPAPRDFFKRKPEEKDQESESLEASLGGPILRDKAWFFAAYNDSTTGNFDQLIGGRLIDSSVEFSAKIAKLNFQPGTQHQVALSWVDSPVRRNYAHVPQNDEWGHTPHDLSGDLASLSWNFSISSDLFLETKLATQTSDENKLLAANGDTDIVQAILTKQRAPNGYPGDPAMAELCALENLGGDACHLPGNNYRVYADDADNQSWHNGWILDNGFGLNEYPREQANAALTWFASEHHEAKFGVDWQEVEWRQDVHRMGFYNGDNFNPASPTGYDNCGFAQGNICSWIDYNPPDLVAQGRSSADSKNANLTLYARDRFTIGDHWTFNVGVRAAQQENLNDLDHKVVDTTTIEPRFSTSYDIKGDGKMLASLNLGRYYAQLNQQFTNRWLMEGWTGHNASDWWLYCSALDVFLGSSGIVPALGFCGFFGEGYTVPFQQDRPGRQFELAAAGVIPPIELDPYYKDEIIIGFEWQFARNWAFDAKAIYWELGDMIMNTIQREPDNTTFLLSSSVDNFRTNLRALGAVPEHLINAFEDPFKEYTAVQFQLNRQFSKGFAVYNNLTLAKLETTGSGAWWDNSSSAYGEDLGQVLTQGTINACTALQAARTVPVDCQALLSPHLGKSLSTINRAGRDGLQGGVGSGGESHQGSGVDREYIWKTFGFKQWNVGNHTFNLGGLLSVQGGVAWGRAENLPAPSVNDILNNVFVPLERNGTRRLDGFYDLNLSAAWSFPIRGDVRGELRVEGTNVTNEQEQINVGLYGEPMRVRRDFQRPRQLRSMLSVRF
ncbi:MAG TPA: carboxypeptidase regulatory-like domain-containing protein [Thermoanaerobaculia bacterium]|nr:carboxypeptidase regulatory-like domain-containing protein [Thermoanaerobaculia bacterium]